MKKTETSQGRTIAPFRAVRYAASAGDLGSVTAPPYDVISPEKQKRLYEKDPHNIVRIDFGLELPTDSDRENRYTRSRVLLKDWLREGVLVRDPEPSFYLYDQTFMIEGRGTYCRRGFFALRRLEEFREGGVRPHEKTLSAPKEDRLLLMKATEANLSSIFSLYSDPTGGLKGLLDPHFKKNPLAAFTDGDGIGHRFWKVSDPTLFDKADRILQGRSLFIADGHHRYETAVTYRNWMRERHPKAPDEAAFNYVLMFLADMDDPGLVVLPTHRAVKGLKFNTKDLMGGLRRWFEVQEVSPGRQEQLIGDLRGTPPRKHRIGVLIGGSSEMFRIEISEEKLDDLPSLRGLPTVARRVDTAILHTVILRDLLGLAEEDQKDPRFIRFIKDDREALRAAKDPETQAVFLVNPPSMDLLRQVGEAGLVLPPKTTFFYPKILTGLVINPLEETT